MFVYIEQIDASTFEIKSSTNIPNNTVFSLKNAGGSASKLTKYATQLNNGSHISNDLEKLTSALEIAHLQILAGL